MPENDAQAHSELATFGEELRREREIRGISLKEIADSTKISKRFLEAIERNDHKTLPAPVFTRGFVREYARYLGLNIDEMVNRYNYAAAGDDRIEKTPHLERLLSPQENLAKDLPRQSTPDKLRGIPRSYARVDRNIYFLIAIVVALAGAGLWVLSRRQAAKNTEVPIAAAVATSSHASSPAIPATSTVAIPQPAADVLRLTLELTDDSWVTLEADGKTVISDELKAGERRTFEAHDSFRFKTIGNAAGVRLTLNDHAIAPLGKQGKVLHDRVFDRAYLQRVTAEEQPRSTP